MGPLAIPPLRRAHVALGCGVLALVLVAVLPPVAWIPGVAAVVVGADAREHDRRMGQPDTAAFAGMALGAVAIAVAIALVVAAVGGA